MLNSSRKSVDDYYPEAYLITVVQDNLNTHTPASLYKAFEPSEARRILNRLDFCYTPKHGSWLNMAEIEPLCFVSTMPISPNSRLDNIERRSGLLV